MRSIATKMMVGCAIVVTGACGAPNDESAGDLPGTRESITLTGCLQQGGGAFRPGYMLTMLNEPAGGGTSGSVTQSGSSVEREQMRIAARTYRLSPTGEVELDGMLGKQIRVTGVITDDADVPNGNGAIGSDSDSQRPNRDVAEQTRQGAQLDTSQLARLDVTSASVVSEACGDRRELTGANGSGTESATPSGVGPAK